MTAEAPAAPLVHLRALVADAAAAGRGRLAACLLLMVAGAAAEASGAVLLVGLLRHLTGDGSGAGDSLAGLALATGLCVLVAGAAVLIVRARTIVAAGLRDAVLDRLRGELHRAILATDLAVFQTIRAADLKDLMTGGIGRIGLAVDMTLQVVVVSLTAPALLAAAFWLAPGLTAATLAFVPLAVLATRAAGRRGWRLGRRLGEAHRAAMADLSDDLDGFAVIRALGAGPDRADRLAGRFAAVRAAQADHVRHHATDRAALQLAAAVAGAAVLLLAVGWLRLPTETALVLLLTQTRLLSLVLRGLSQWRAATTALPALEAVADMRARLAAGAEAARTVAAQPAPADRIELDGVRVVRADGRVALDGIDAHVPAGRITALVGRSGAGKSTLAETIAGLRTPTAGALRVDGVPLAGVALPGWRARVGHVPQDAFLFHDTIRANLTLAAPDADEAHLRAALDAAAVLSVVDALPDGLDTVVGDRGARISGGERQRIALARAFVRRPAVLVLDEATAALDAGAEAAVLDALHALRGRATVVVVSHRLSTVRSADHVIWLEGGRLLAEGPWTEVRAVAAARGVEAGLTEA